MQVPGLWCHVAEFLAFWWMVVHSSSFSSNQRRLLDPEEKSTTVCRKAQNYSPDNTVSQPTRLEYSANTAARTPNPISIYRMSQEEWTKLWESVPYVELYRYNPKHLYPKLNVYGDNGKRSLKLWQLLLTYWLPNTYWNWQEYVVSVMLMSVLNIKVTCEWHKAIKLNYKNTRTTVVFVLRFPSTLRRPQLFRYLAKVTALRC